MPNILDFVQTYVAKNTANHNFEETEFKLKSCSEALILTIKTIIYVYTQRQNIFSLFIRIPIIYYFSCNSKILVNK